MNNIVTQIETSLQRGDLDNVPEIVRELVAVKILDPAWGSGSFIRALVKRMEEKYNTYDNTLTKPKMLIQAYVI
jgi:hypothetical protein